MALLCLLAFGNILRSTSFVRDDNYLVASNPILHMPGGFWRLWTTDYVEGMMGKDSGLSLYRPAAMASHWLDVKLFGDLIRPMHAMNLLFYWVAVMLLYLSLKGFLDPLTAWLAASLFAVFPIHSEVVDVLVYRTEILAMIGMLSAWMLLRGKATTARITLGTLAFVFALLSKEHSVLFPILLAMSDWAFDGRKPWQMDRWKVYGVLALTTLAYLALRARLFEHPFEDGVSYFPDNVSALSRALTIARFWFTQYLWPTLSGAGLAVDDYSRPWIADSGLWDVLAWTCLMTLAATVAASCYALLRLRSKAAFWILLAFLFLLPTTHFFPLSALGGQRFFFFPSIAVAVGAGYALKRLIKQRLAGPAWTVWGAAILFLIGCDLPRNQVWQSRANYYRASVLANPSSESAHFGLAMVLLDHGDRTGADRELRDCIRLNPASAIAYYSLGKMAWENGNTTAAEALFREALSRNPRSPATLDFLGVIAESHGNLSEAEARFRTALEIQPLDSVADYNLGLLYWKSGRKQDAQKQLRTFLNQFPNDPDAAHAEMLLSSSESVSLK